MPGDPRALPKVDPDGTPPVEGFDGKTRAELEALAVERGTDVSKATSKAEVIAALKAAQAR